MPYAEGMGIFAIIVSSIGVAFCGVLTGAVFMERDGASSADDMNELFETETILVD